MRISPPYTYRLYELLIHSSIAMQGLIAVEKELDENTEPDISIRVGEVAPLPGEQETTISLSFTTPTEVSFYYKNIARYLVRTGSEIIVMPAPGVEDHLLQIFILGVCFGVLLHQRGALVLHASSVAVHDQVVAFMGHSGWGKSATAAALHMRGHSIIADDIVALNVQHGEKPQILPGPLQLKLCPDAVSTVLQVDASKLPQLLPQREKRTYRIENSNLQTCPPLAAIFVLNQAKKISIEAISPQEAFLEMLRFSYLAKLIEKTKTLQQHFHQCAYLVQHVPVLRLHRPQNLSLLSDVVQMVEQHVRMLGQACVKKV